MDRRTGHRMNRARVILATLITAAFLVGSPSPANAAMNFPDLPGLPGIDLIPGDCAADVTVTTPLSGPANSIDGGPRHPRTGSPFTNTPHSTIYESYGYGGLSWPSLESGCDLGDLTGNGVAHPGDSAAGTLANIGLEGLAVVCAIVTAVLRFAFAPATFAIFDPIMALSAHVLGDTIFRALFWATLIITGILILSRVHKAQLKDVAHDAGWVTMAGLIGVAATAWPLVVAPMFDHALTSGVGAISSSMADPTGSSVLNAADGAAANLHESLLYQTWCSGMVGRANTTTSDKFCPRLFMAATISRAEWASVRGNADKVQELVDAHQTAFNDVADQLKAEDPSAYEYLNGKHNTDRIWFAALGWFGLLCAAPFVFMAGLLLIYALIVIRLGIMVAPAVVVIGGYPPLRRYLTGVFDYVLGAVATAFIFGSLAAVFVGMIGAFMGPRSNIHPLLSMVLLGVTTVAAWKFTKPMRKVRSLADIKQRFGPHKAWPTTGPDGEPLTNGPVMSDSAGIFSPSGAPTRYEHTTPAEARPSMASAAMQGAMQGATASVLAGLASGGTVTMAAAAGGAAKGAGGAAIAQGFADRGSAAAETTTPPALPGPTTPTAPPRVYSPAETISPDVRVVHPVEDGADMVYPLYQPSDSEGVL